MGQRPVPLTTLKGGINRLKVKGGASAQQLYDLTNAYLTQAGTVVPREGTIRSATLNSNTVGLSAFDGIFNVFSTALQSVPAGYVDNLLIPPPASAAATLSKILFAKLFLGFPYVVALYSDGKIYHFWLQSGGTWTANTVEQTGAIVTPTTPNGLAYMATRAMPPHSTWTPQSTVTAGTVVEPTEANGYSFRAVAVAGTSPHTGSTEPAWPSTEGAIIQEFGDFDVNSNDNGTTGAVQNAPLGSTITDRYGDSGDVAGQTGTASASDVSSVSASTVVTTWAAGTLYPPGSVVQPSTSQGAFINAIPNGDFEAGDDGNWTKGTGWTIGTSLPYQGSFAGEFSHTGAINSELTMFNFGTVTPGQSVTATAQAEGDSDGQIFLKLKWYDGSDSHISDTTGTTSSGGGGTNPAGYSLITVTGSAPVGAAHCRVSVLYTTGSGAARAGRVDLVVWNLETPAAISNFLFEAIQAAPGSSGSTEPAWPTTAGNTVIDNQVTWKAIGTSIITWQAIPIMLTGASEPIWPTTVGISIHDASTFTSQDAHVTDTSLSWVAINRQVPVPNPGPAVAINSSHVFNGDKDIVDFSAAVDPTDWTSTNNAGYLPTGLNNYGDNPVAALTLYRSNLMVFNAGGYQMWQTDPDPANMALLDAEPVGSIYGRAWQSVSNDLLGLTEVGVRNIGTVGASANMQEGSLGQPVDPLVKARLVANTYGPYGFAGPISTYYPGRGQYWLIFGPEAFVLTVSGVGQKSWSRYLFPDTITDTTLNGGILYLRTAGNLVWQLDYETIVDDFGIGFGNTQFNSLMQWPYLDVGVIGINKMLAGFDLAGYGSVTVQMAYQQGDPTTFSDNAGFSTSLNVTAPYVVNIAETVPGDPLPLPINAPSYSLILQFASNQSGLQAPNSPSWEWEAANLYVMDQSGGGATG